MDHTAAISVWLVNNRVVYGDRSCYAAAFFPPIEVHSLPQSHRARGWSQPFGAFCKKLGVFC
jgi:hypothetical protein